MCFPSFAPIHLSQEGAFRAAPGPLCGLSQAERPKRLITSSDLAPLLTAASRSWGPSGSPAAGWPMLSY